MPMEGDVMNKILNKKEVSEFIERYKIKGYTIIIKIDEENKKASYVIDGEKEIEENYDELIKFINNKS